MAKTFCDEFWEYFGPQVAGLSPRGHYRENRTIVDNIYACLANSHQLIEASIALFQTSHVAQAGALACSSLDEIGKAVEQLRGQQIDGQPMTKVTFDHRKRQLTATWPLAFESGPSRRMGEIEKIFGALFRSGLEEFRQRCLYVTSGPNGPTETPQTVTADEAFAVICGAVESLTAYFDVPGEMETTIRGLQQRLTAMNRGYKA